MMYMALTNFFFGGGGGGGEGGGGVGEMEAAREWGVW